MSKRSSLASYVRLTLLGFGFVLVNTLLPGCGDGGKGQDRSPIMNVTLFSAVDDHGKFMEAKNIFQLGEHVRALVHLDPTVLKSERALVFHILWLGPDRRDLFKKRIEYHPGKSPLTLRSSIRLRSNRQPGAYAFHIYLFRQLIHEERFFVRSDYMAWIYRDQMREAFPD